MSLPTSLFVRRVALSLAFIAAVAACASPSTGLPTAAPVSGGAAPPAAASGDPAAVPSGALTDPAQAWPAFAACLRAHGLNVPDPDIDENGDPIWSNDVDLKKDISEPARRACNPIIAAIRESGPKRPRATYTFESLVAHAACMRGHGVPTWPDPDPNDLQAGMPEGFDKRDPIVYPALVACESKLVETTASPSPSL
jgi:hypothetical protein